MTALIDLSGRRFGKLLVISRGEDFQNKEPRWVCLCACGEECLVRGSKLRANRTKSCGCHRGAAIAETHRTHGQSRTRLYRAWNSMRQRCDPNRAAEFPRYSGSGIRVCREWERFEPFYEWATANGYRADLSIDRIDGCGNYTPDNCRWATPLEQSQNLKTNVLLTHNGETLCIEEWARRSTLTSGGFRRRLESGWPIELALTAPPRRGHRLRI